MAGVVQGLDQVEIAFARLSTSWEIDEFAGRPFLQLLGDELMLPIILFAQHWIANTREKSIIGGNATQTTWGYKIANKVFVMLPLIISSSRADSTELL